MCKDFYCEDSNLIHASGRLPDIEKKKSYFKTQHLLPLVVSLSFINRAALLQVDVFSRGHATLHRSVGRSIVWSIGQSVTFLNFCITAPAHLSATGLQCIRPYSPCLSKCHVPFWARFTHYKHTHAPKLSLIIIRTNHTEIYSVYNTHTGHSNNLGQK